MRAGLALAACGAALALCWPAAAQPAGGGAAPAAPADAASDYRPPADVHVRPAGFLSDNVRLAGAWFQAAGGEGGRRPTVILAPGWGGVAADLRADAVDLARAGYLVLLFDYRGWGASDGRLARGAGGAARELRGYVDPWEQAEDWFNAVSYAGAEPAADPGRIGLMGADLAGGHVLHVAAHDARVKALVSLVSRVDLRPYKPYEPDPARTLAEANAAAAALATGRADWPSEGARAVGNKAVRWAPVEEADRVAAAALFVLAENEALFSNTNNGQMACEKVSGARKLVMLPKIGHDGVRGGERERAMAAAIGWLDRHLKATPEGEPERGECFPPPEPPKGEEDPNGSGEGHRAQDASGRWN